MTRIDVVMATRNGAAHLAEQLDSIIDQTHHDWRLIIRDDGSSDRTAEIVEQYRRNHPNRITVLSDTDGPVGFAQNFVGAIAESDASYVALCDQDDVWLPDKLATTLAALSALETRVGASTPSLVFSDLVDAELNVLAESFWQYAQLDPTTATDLAALIVRNVVTGNTMMFNAALRELVLPIPTSVEFHDAWIAAVACAAGSTTFVAEPTVLYRQHAANASGAKQPTPTTPAGLISAVRDRPTDKQRQQRHHAWVGELRGRTTALLSPRDRAVLDAFLELPHLGFVQRFRSARRHGLLPRGLLRSVAFVARTRSGARPGDEEVHSSPP